MNTNNLIGICIVGIVLIAVGFGALFMQISLDEDKKRLVTLKHDAYQNLVIGKLDLAQANATEAIKLVRKDSRLGRPDPKMSAILACALTERDWLRRQNAPAGQEVLPALETTRAVEEALAENANCALANAAQGNLFMFVPKDADLHIYYGKQIAQFEAALKLDPNDPYIHNQLGVALVEDNQWERAKMEYETALKLKPDMAWVAYNLKSLDNQIKNPSHHRPSWIKQELQWDDVADLKANDVNAMANEILAAAGKDFQDSRLCNYYHGLGYRQVAPEPELTVQQGKNVKLLGEISKLLASHSNDTVKEALVAELRDKLNEAISDALLEAKLRALLENNRVD